jgi:hypothetical protein
MQAFPRASRWAACCGLLALLVLVPAQAMPAAQRPAGAADDAATTATHFVPVESWVYTAFERLAALGVVQSDISGLRPWTRRECLRLLEEAEELAYGEKRREVVNLLRRLQRELQPVAARLAGAPELGVDSVHVRTMVHSGTPLDDAYHFGQSVANDFGRPHRHGLNQILGASVSGGYRAFSWAATGEYRYAPSAEALPLAARQAIATLDQTPLLPGTRQPRVSDLRLLDAYVAYSREGWTLAVGNQSLRWGHLRSGSLSLAENAEPVTMIRLSRTRPFLLPWPLRWTGPVRSEFLTGRLRGHRFVNIENQILGPNLERQPYIHGVRVGFKPTPNLELGFGATNVWGGPRVPLTLRSFFRSLSLSNAPVASDLNDPGDRRSSFDLKYRVPLLRDHLTVYVESMNEDEFSPIAYPRKSAWAAGVYLPGLPRLPHVDLRAEGFYTDLPGDPRQGIFFANARYLDGFSNQGSILGHPVGRQGRGFELRSSYWSEGMTPLQLIYRDYRASDGFLPGGGTHRSGGAHLQREFYVEGLQSRVALSALLQYEWQKIPVLSAQPRNNFTFSTRLELLPRVPATGRP